MAKTVLLDYALRKSGQTLLVDLRDYSAVVSSRVRFKGERRAVTGPAEYATNTNAGQTSTTFPPAPAGYSFYRHFIVGIADIKNNTSARINPTLIVNSPFGNSTGSGSIEPGATETIWVTSPYIYSNYIGETVTLSVNADGGTVLDRRLGADTTGVRYPTSYLQTKDPKVTVGEFVAQHLGELTHGAESDWLNFSGLSVQQNTLAVTVSGSKQVWVKIEATVEPKLPSPETHSPTTGARLDNRRPWFEFTLLGNPENSAVKYHARARVSTFSTMNSSIIMESMNGTGEWEYLSGGVWLPFPEEGVNPGTRVRVRLGSELSYKTYYWDCASYDGHSYGVNSAALGFRVMVAVTSLFSVIHKDSELTKISAISVTETCNGEIGEFSITMYYQDEETGELILDKLKYGDTIILAVNDHLNNTEEYHGLVRVKEPCGMGLVRITCLTGDGILGERIAKQDYPAQDVGLTVKHLIETYCSPLTAVNVNTNTGFVAPVQAKDRPVISVLEGIRSDFAVFYYVDKDNDMNFYKQDEIEDAIVQIQYGANGITLMGGM